MTKMLMLMFCSLGWLISQLVSNERSVLAGSGSLTALQSYVVAWQKIRFSATVHTASSPASPASRTPPTYPQISMCPRLVGCITLPCLALPAVGPQPRVQFGIAECRAESEASELPSLPYPAHVRRWHRQILRIIRARSSDELPVIIKIYSHASSWSHLLHSNVRVICPKNASCRACSGGWSSTAQVWSRNVDEVDVSVTLTLLFLKQPRATLPL